MLKRQHPWFIGLVSGMASYIDAAAIVSNGTALVLYEKGGNINASELGILSGALTICIAIGALMGGRLGDRYGRRIVFLMTMLMILAGTLVMTFMPHFYSMMFGVILVGLATGADLPVSLATISESANDSNRGKIIGASNLLWTMGIVSAVAIGSVVGDWGVIGAKLLYGHVCLIAGIVFILRLSIPESPLWIAARNESKQGLNTIRANDVNYKHLFSPKYLWPFLALCVFYSCTNLAANTLGQFGTYISLNVVGISVSTNAFINLCILPLGLCANVIFMRVVDTNKRIPFFIIGACLLTAGYALPAIFKFHPISWYACVICIHLGNGFAFEGIMKVWAQETFPTMLRATAQGAIVAISRLLCGILAMFTPALIQAGASVFHTILSVTVATGVFAGWLCFHSRKTTIFHEESGSAAAEGDRTHNQTVSG